MRGKDCSPESSLLHGFFMCVFTKLTLSPFRLLYYFLVIQKPLFIFSLIFEVRIFWYSFSTRFILRLIYTTPKFGDGILVFLENWNSESCKNKLTGFPTLKSRHFFFYIKIKLGTRSTLTGNVLILLLSYSNIR